MIKVLENDELNCNLLSTDPLCMVKPSSVSHETTGTKSLTEDGT